MGEGAQDYLSHCPMPSWKLPAVETPQHSWGGYSSDWSHFTKFIACIDIKCFCTMCTHFSLFSPCRSLWRKSLCSVCSFPLSTVMLGWGSPESSLYQREKTLHYFSLSSWGKSCSSSAVLFVTLLGILSIFFKFHRLEPGTVHQDIPIPFIQINVSL